MSTTRREKLEAMLRESPHDAFLQYALALEQEKAGEHDASLAALEKLARQAPSYIPAFHMAGRQLVGLGRIDEARAILRDGIVAARSQGDLHAAGEMSELLSSLGQFGE
jgi:hypothetical protein